MSESDHTELSVRLRALAQSLQVTSDGIHRAVAEAQSTVVRAGDDDHLVEVVLDGRPRVRDIHLSRTAMQDADRLDRVLTQVLNDALGRARAGSQEAVLAALPADVRMQAENPEEMP